MSTVLFVAMALAACDDDGGRGPGVTSSAEHLEATLPFDNNLCFTQPLLDVLPDTPGDQFECTALLDGEVIPACDSTEPQAEPCWEIVIATEDSQSCSSPSVRGGNDGQFLSIDCVVVE